jgi:hypothetical protein
LAQLNLAIVVLNGEYHFFEMQQVLALQFVQLATNLFCYVEKSARQACHLAHSQRSMLRLVECFTILLM